MEKFKLLIQQAGQPRLPLETLPWKQNYVTELSEYFKNKRGIEIEVTWKYDLWDKIGSSQQKARGDELESVDTVELTKQLQDAHNGKADIKFHSYDVVDTEFERLVGLGVIEYTEQLRLDYHRVVSQTICRGLAMERTSNEYDAIILCRTDNVLILEDAKKIDLAKLLTRDNTRKYGNSTEYFVYVDYVEYRSSVGLCTGDQFLISDGNGLRAMYSNFREDVAYFLKDHLRTQNEFGPHSSLASVDPHNLCTGFIYSSRIPMLKKNKHSRDIPSEFVTIAADVAIRDSHTVLRPQCVELKDLPFTLESMRDIGRGWKKYLG